MRNWSQRNEPRGPAAEKPKGPRISRQKKARMTRDAEYNVLASVYKEAEPTCVECQRKPELLTVDHIVRGNAGRSASLLHFDTWLVRCADCHNRENMTFTDKVIAKVICVLRAIQRLRGKQFSAGEVERIRAGIISELKG